MRLEKALNVFRQDIGLKVDLAARGQRPQRGNGQCVRNKRYAEAILLAFDDCEAHAVHGDRSFRGHLHGQVPGHGKPERGPIALIDPFDKCAGAVDVSGDEMSAQSSAHGQGAFQIDAASRY